MPAAVVAFAFGTPNTLRSNRCIAQIASETAASLRIPVYTQHDVVPLASDVEVELTEEKYPERVPTLRIARGAIAWAQVREIDVLWLCAAGPHIARCRRDLRYAIKERRTAIEVRITPGLTSCPADFWFCSDSTQVDTRSRVVWQLRDTILMNSPMRLYSLIAS